MSVVIEARIVTAEDMAGATTAFLKIADGFEREKFFAFLSGLFASQAPEPKEPEEEGATP